jgi:hypothetical protein
MHAILNLTRRYVIAAAALLASAQSPAAANTPNVSAPEPRQVATDLAAPAGFEFRELANGRIEVSRQSLEGKPATVIAVAQPVSAARLLRGEGVKWRVGRKSVSAPPAASTEEERAATAIALKRAIDLAARKAEARRQRDASRPREVSSDDMGGRDDRRGPSAGDQEGRE